MNISRKNKTLAYVALGFTLIELLIVVAIIGIIAAFALPSYQCSVERSQRASAVQVMYEGTQWMERFFTTNNGYLIGGAPTALPAPLDRSPKEAATPPAALYTIAVNATSQTAFTITATPNRVSSCTPACGAMTINQLQVRTANGGTDAATINACFQR
jgi:type IV pilus assembly protein PilE